MEWESVRRSQVRVDIDSKDWYPLFKCLTMLKYLCLSFKVYETLKGYHVYVYTNKRLSEWQVWTLRAVLGDDPLRLEVDLKRINRLTGFNTMFQAKKSREGFSVEKPL